MSNQGFYAVSLAIVVGVFVCGLWIFLPSFLKVRTFTEALFCVPFVAILLFGLIIGCRISLERLCSVELSEERGIFRLKYRIVRWARDVQVPAKDVTAVVSQRRWYGNQVKITIKGRTYAVGDLLAEDMEIVARELRRVLQI